MGKILLQYVDFCSLPASLILLQCGAVLADVIGLDVRGVEAVEGLDGGRHRLGGPVVLGGGYWVYSRGQAQHCSL